MRRRYLSTSDLPSVFGKSQDWFRNRVGRLFKIGEHVFQPEEKGGLFWDVEAVDQVIRQQSTAPAEPSQHDELIRNLLQ